MLAAAHSGELWSIPVEYKTEEVRMQFKNWKTTCRTTSSGQQGARPEYVIIFDLVVPEAAEVPLLNEDAVA